MLRTLLNMVIFANANKMRSILVAGTLTTGLAGIPSAAFARHHGEVHIDLPLPGPAIMVQSAPCNTAPVQVWVPPVYQTIIDRVWLPEVTATRCESVEIPAEYGYRDVVRVDSRGREFIHREHVLICPARVEERPVTVCVSPGHFEEQTHQQLLTDGHWESRFVQSEPTRIVEHPRLRLEIPSPF